MLEKIYGLEFDTESEGKMHFTQNIESASIHICEVCLKGIEQLRTGTRSA